MSCEAPKPKKQKLETKEADDYDEEEEFEDDSNVQQAEKDDNGDSFFALSKNRRCTVRSFKGKALIDIREVSLL